MIYQLSGLGIGWRPELALDISRRKGIAFVEIVAENVDPNRIPRSLLDLRERGVQVIPHGISLSLGGVEQLDRARVRRLAELAGVFESPLISEHIAFVRAGGLEAGHLLALPRTKTAIGVLVDNVRVVQEMVDVPLALENISALFEWPDAEMSDAEFISQVLERTGCRLLLDVANVWANARNLSGDPVEMLKQLPLDRVGYVHVGGGEERDGVYHDTHAADVPRGVLELLEDLCAIAEPLGVLLERDDHFPSSEGLNLELDAIAAAVARGHARKRPVNAA